jgi:hypothetical protein
MAVPTPLACCLSALFESISKANGTKRHLKALELKNDYFRRVRAKGESCQDRGLSERTDCSLPNQAQVNQKLTILPYNH